MSVNLWKVEYKLICCTSRDVQEWLFDEGYLNFDDRTMCFHSEQDLEDAKKYAKEYAKYIDDDEHLRDNVLALLNFVEPGEVYEVD